MKSSPSADVVTVDLKPFIGPLMNLLSAFIIGGSLIISSSILAKGGTGLANTVTSQTTSSTTATVAANTTGSSSIDDDAIMGNRNSAKVAIIEFSDYECPFCQRFHEQTLSQIKSTYVDTGDAIFVYRDLPLSFHEPAASRAANAAECAKAQGGDTAYYLMHDAIFKNSQTNGAGFTGTGTNTEAELDELSKLATAAGLDGAKLRACTASETYKTEIANDTTAAGSIGISGTPGFLIGTLNADGTVTGEIVSGAYPFSEFERVINKYLGS